MLSNLAPLQLQEVYGFWGPVYRILSTFTYYPDTVICNRTARRPTPLHPETNAQDYKEPETTLRNSSALRRMFGVGCPLSNRSPELGSSQHTCKAMPSMQLFGSEPLLLRSVHLDSLGGSKPNPVRIMCLEMDMSPKDCTSILNPGPKC